MHVSDFLLSAAVGNKTIVGMTCLTVTVCHLRWIVPHAYHSIRHLYRHQIKLGDTRPPSEDAGRPTNVSTLYSTKSSAFALSSSSRDLGVWVDFEDGDGTSVRRRSSTESGEHLSANRLDARGTGASQHRYSKPRSSQTACESPTV